MYKSFKDYSNLVIQVYRMKQKSGELSPRLINPTPASIRNECFEVCHERYSKKDDWCLRMFFGKFTDQESCLALIDQFELGKLKSLQNLLMGDIGKPSQRNIELLAWLIDFDRRPYKMGESYEPLPNEPEIVVPDVPPGGKPDNTNVEVSPSGKESPPTNTEETFSDPPPPIPGDINNLFSNPGNRKGKPKTILVFASVTLVIFAGLTMWFTFSKRPPDNEKCMYWTGDHYEPVSCNRRMGNKLVIGLDSTRLTRLKKINRWDTITQTNLDKVWYAKINGQLELYTDSGMHPVDITKQLKPLTFYMFSKYVASRQSPD